MKIRKIAINIIFSIILMTLFSGCTLFKRSPEINAYIEDKQLLFNLTDQSSAVVYYEINSFEEFKDDGLTYKNILKFKNYDGLYKMKIDNYKEKNILDNHAYYLLAIREGGRIQILGFCINGKSIYIKTDNKNDQKFVSKCHDFRSS